MKRIKAFCKNHYFLASILAAMLLALPMILALSYSNGVAVNGALSQKIQIVVIFDFLICWPILAAVAAYPLVLTGIECFFLLHRPNTLHRTQEQVFDALALFLGAAYTPFYLCFNLNTTRADWPETLRGYALHSPLASWHLPTILVLLALGLIGYWVLTFAPLKKLPPLGIVLSFSGMYLACGVGIAFAVQVVTEPMHFWLGLLPLNLLFITARTVRTKMAEFQALERREKAYRSPLLALADRVLCKSQLWPLLAFLLMWPLLGILICVLALFGQSPSAAIRAFTETSDWNLSQQISPRNIVEYDEHYLCTVAAGGHRKVVHPIRRGVRHGHNVTVNRQLCVANAFEQILEERTPRLHRAVRHFYDTYGFPIARLIRSPYVADLVYFLMKPLEWLFLLVLYAVDPHPEDRIAIQYTGKSVHDFEQ